MWIRDWNLKLLAPEGAGAGQGEGGQQGQGQGQGGQPNGNAEGDKAPGEGFDFPKWRETIKDPKMKAAAEKYNSAEDLLSTAVTLRGEIADRIRLPGPNATAEDMTKFRRSLGVPDEAKGYEVKLPEGVTVSEMDQALIDAVRPIAHEANLSASGFNKLISGMVAKAKEVEAAADKALKDAAAAATAELKKEWSTEFDKNKELAFRTVAAFGGEQLKAALEGALVEGFGKLGDYPPFLRLMAAIGKRSDEGDLLLGGGGGEAKTTAKAELDQLVAANPPGSDGYKKNQKRIQELYGIVHGNQPIVGAQGRVT